MKSQEDRTDRFDVAALHAALDSERRSRRLTWKDVAAQSGVSASTLTRLSQGRQPDVNSLAALTAGSGCPRTISCVPKSLTSSAQQAPLPGSPPSSIGTPT